MKETKTSKKSQEKPFVIGRLGGGMAFFTQAEMQEFSVHGPLYSDVNEESDILYDNLHDLLYDLTDTETEYLEEKEARKQQKNNAGADPSL